MSDVPPTRYAVSLAQRAAGLAALRSIVPRPPVPTEPIADHSYEEAAALPDVPNANIDARFAPGPPPAEGTPLSDAGSPLGEPSPLTRPVPRARRDPKGTPSPTGSSLESGPPTESSETMRTETTGDASSPSTARPALPAVPTTSVTPPSDRTEKPVRLMPDISSMPNAVAQSPPSGEAPHVATRPQSAPLPVTKETVQQEIRHHPFLHPRTGGVASQKTPVTDPAGASPSTAQPAVEVTIGTVEVVADVLSPPEVEPRRDQGFDAYSAMRSYEDWD